MASELSEYSFLFVPPVVPALQRCNDGQKHVLSASTRLASVLPTAKYTSPPSIRLTPTNADFAASPAGVLPEPRPGALAVLPFWGTGADVRV